MTFDPNWLSAGASIAMVGATFWYVRVAEKSLTASNRAVEEMAEQSLMQSRPYVTISVVTPPGTVSIFLVIENVGKSAAQKVRFTLKGDFQPFASSGTGIRPLREVDIFNREIRSFSPGTKMTFQLDSFKVLSPKDMEEHPEKYQFEVLAEYEYMKRSLSERVCVDLRDWRGGEIEPTVALDHLEKIHSCIKDLEDPLRRIADHFESDQ